MTITTRVYPAISARQQARQTLAYSFDDIVRIISLAVAANEPANILLGGNIVMASPLIVPSKLPSFSIDGGGRYGFVIKGSVDRLFTLRCPSVFSDVDVTLNSGAVVGTCWTIQTSPVTFHGIDIDAQKGTLNDVFGTGLASGSFGQLSMTVADIDGVGNLFADDGPLCLWSACALADIVVNGKNFTPVTLGRGATGPSFSASTFDRISGQLNVQLGGAGANNVFTACSQMTNLVTNSTPGNGSVFIACFSLGTTLSGGDVWIAGDGTTLSPTTAPSFAASTNGTAATPAFRFVGSPGNGAYLAASNDWRLSAGGTDNVRMTSTATVVSTALTASSTLTVAGNTTMTGTLTVLGAAQFNDPVLFTDVVTDNIGTQTATGANYTILPTDNCISLTCTNITGSLRISTTGVSTGTPLTIRVAAMTGTNSATLPDSTASNVRLQGVWTPAAFAQIKLRYWGQYWEEESRIQN